jgi:hypothetical protein
MKEKSGDKSAIVVAALLICGLCLLGAFISLAEAVAQEAQEKAEARPENNASAVSQIPRVEYSAVSFRDPFKSFLGEDKGPGTGLAQADLASKPLPDLKVQGIIWGGSFPQAIINNKVVKVGDTIDNARIIEINKDGIEVFYGNRQYNLSSPAKVTYPNTGAKAKPEGGKDGENF